MVPCHSCSLETMGLSNSSNINEGIRAVLFFKRKDFARTKSAKSTKRKQATFTQMFFFLCAQKMQKAQNAQKVQNARQVTFFLLDVFYVHKNAAFFVFVRLDNFKLLCFFYKKI